MTNPYGQRGYPPRQAVTRRKPLSKAEKIAHAFLIICTFGLWFPVYWYRKRSQPLVTEYY